MEFQTFIEKGLKLGAEFLELRYMKSKDTSIQYTDGTLKNFSSNSDEGLAIRIFYNGAWGFSSTSSLAYESILNAIEQAYKIARISSNYIKERYKIKEFKSIKANVSTKFRINFDDISYEQKINLVKYLDNSIRSFDNRIKSDTVRYNESQDEILIMNSFGTEVFKKEIYVSVSALSISLEAGKRGRGYVARGGTGGYELLKEFNVEEIGILSAKKAIEQLYATSAKAGSYTCIMDPILVGVFAHEGIGHPSEADSIVDKNSVLEGKLGEKIASENVTIIDNPLLEKCFGSFDYDDEGFPARPRYIIKNGILNEYLHNMETSSILRLENNAAARADSYLNPPLVRMSNIYFDKGDASFEEMLEDIELGIYAKGFEYGYVMPNNGQFTFKCESGYLIEKGNLTKPLRDLSISGIILETLKNIDLVGKDLEIKSIGHCGKDGQWVRVGDGGPHLRVKGVVVGGVE
jgi:TldD protein